MPGTSTLLCMPPAPASLCTSADLQHFYFSFWFLVSFSFKWLSAFNNTTQNFTRRDSYPVCFLSAAQEEVGIRSCRLRTNRLPITWGPSELHRLHIYGLGDLVGEVQAGFSAVPCTALFLPAFWLPGLHPACLPIPLPSPCPPHPGDVPTSSDLTPCQSRVASPLLQRPGFLLCSHHAGHSFCCNTLYPVQTSHITQEFCDFTKVIFLTPDCLSVSGAQRQTPHQRTSIKPPKEERFYIC